MLRGHADANLPPGAARRGSQSAARLLHPPRRRAVRARRWAAVRPDAVAVAAASEPGADLSAWLGQRLCRLARGEVDAERLRDLLVSVLPSADLPVFAVDVTTWPRCDAR